MDKDLVVLGLEGWVRAVCFPEILDLIHNLIQKFMKFMVIIHSINLAQIVNLDLRTPHILFLRTCSQLTPKLKTNHLINKL